MFKTTKPYGVAVALAWSLAAPFGAGAQDARNFTIGTGSVAGVYFPVGQAICGVVNAGSDRHGYHCEAVNSGGSADNIKAIQSGERQFGIAQSDVQFFAAKGYGPFKAAGPDGKLREVLALYTESFVVVARDGSDIKRLDDLKGKRVNIGNPGSGQRVNMDLVMAAKGWGADAFAQVTELDAKTQAQALCKGEIDAFVFVAGHPNEALRHTIADCKAHLVEVWGPEIESQIARFPYYRAVSISDQTYPGMKSALRTFGVTASLVTSADASEDLVHDVVMSVISKFTDFKFSNRALFELTPGEMVPSGDTPPPHPGSLKYFKQSTDLHKAMEVKPGKRR
ncbi:MAG: TAXI family TRAP transporter solute-binding subunit [Alphaproteobacteria bacterium]|nr:TAXI family TRAP transporter solute-binding subunit [Alphaproteobacteria bacterium]